MDFKLRGQPDFSQMRQYVRETLLRYMSDPRSPTSAKPAASLVAAAAAAEASCFQVTCQRLQLTEETCDSSSVIKPIYGSITQVVLANLDPDRGLSGLTRVAGDKAFLLRIGEATERDFDAAPTQDMQDFIDRQAMVEPIKPKTSDTYPCPRCRGPTQSQGLQTRSADEQQTIFCRCPACDFHFTR